MKGCMCGHAAFLKISDEGGMTYGSKKGLL